MTSYKNLSSFADGLNKQNSKVKPSPLQKSPRSTLEILRTIENSRNDDSVTPAVNHLSAELAPLVEENELFDLLRENLTQMTIITSRLLEYIPSLGWSSRTVKNPVLEQFFSDMSAFEDNVEESLVHFEELRVLSQQFPDVYGPLAWEQLRNFLTYVTTLHTQVKHDLRYTAGRQYRGTRFSTERDETIPMDIMLIPQELEKKFDTPDTVFRIDPTDTGDTFRELLIMMNSRLQDFLNSIMNTPYLQQIYAYKRKAVARTPEPDCHEISPVSHYLQSIPEIQDLEQQIHEAALLGFDDITTTVAHIRRTLLESTNTGTEERIAYTDFFYENCSEIRWDIALEIYKSYTAAFPIYLFNVRRFHKQRSLKDIQEQITLFLDLLRRDEVTARNLERKYTKLTVLLRTLKDMPELVEPAFQLVHPRHEVPVEIVKARQSMQKWIHDASLSLNDIIGQIDRIYERTQETGVEELLFPREMENILYGLQNLFFISSPEPGLTIQKMPEEK